MTRRGEHQGRLRIASLLLAVLGAAIPSLGLAEDGGGVSLDEGNAAAMGQVADLLSNGADLNEGGADLFHAEGSLNGEVNLHQTQVPANMDEVTPEQLGQALENRTSSSQGSSRGQGSQSRSR